MIGVRFNTVALSLGCATLVADSSIQQGFEVIEHGLHADEFHSARIVNVSMFGETKAPPARIGCAEYPDAGSAKEIRRVKHAGIDAEEGVGLVDDFQSVNQRKPPRVNDAAVKALEIQPRLFEVHHKCDKIRMTIEEVGEEMLEKMRRPDFFRLGFVVDRQNALAGGRGLQEILNTRASAWRKPWGPREVFDLQRWIQMSGD
jgi:hypothetical protein